MVDRPLKWLIKRQRIAVTDRQKSCPEYSPKLLLSWVKLVFTKFLPGLLKLYSLISFQGKF